MRALGVATLAAVLGFFSILALNLVRPEKPARPLERDFTRWHRLEADEPAPRFTLINQDGQRISLDGLRGRAVVMTFFFSQCGDVCPTQLEVLDGLGAELSAAERERVTLVGITLDPLRDTPLRLKRFLSERGLDGRHWQLLTGSEEELTAVAADYGIVVRPAALGDLVHNSVYILIDPAGNQRAELHGIATPRQEILKDIRALLALASPAMGG